MPRPPTGSQYASAAAGSRATTRRRSRGRLLAVIGGAALVLVAGATAAYAVSQRDQGTDPDAPAANAAASEQAVPLDEQCTDEIMSNERWVCLTSATFSGGQLVIEYDVEWAGSVPDTSNGYHLHIYGGDGTDPSEEIMGDQAGEDEQGIWKVRDERPAVLSAEDVSEVVGDYPKVCARIANGHHGLVSDPEGGYTTGNCVPIEY